MMDVPIADALPGLALKAGLPDKCVAIDALILIKGIDEDGIPTWFARETTGMSDVEVIGALAVMLRHSQDQFESRWEPDEGGS